MSRPLKWSYGITTVPERFDTYFPTTLESLKLAGFDQPRLFIDGCKDSSQYEPLGLEITTRYPTLRTAGNWVLSLYELYYRVPDADRYAVFQDDFITYRNLRSYLEALDYPSGGEGGGGYCNLYTFPSNQSILPKNSNGWFKSDQLGKGAVALVFSNEAVRVLLSSKHLTDRPMDAHRGWRSIDGGIVDSFRKAGWTEFVHNPSLVQHIGCVSSMRNRQHPKSLSFLGSEVDAMTLLK